MRRSGLIAVGTLVALSAAAHAQSSVTNNRLMFDPAGMQNTDSRKTTPPSASVTTGQTVAREPAGTVAAPSKPASTVTHTAAPGAQAAKPATKPQPAARTASGSSAPAQPAAPARRPAPITTDRAAPEPGRAAERPVPREQAPALGRVALPQGSLGYEGRTQMQTYDMSDGRRVPGFENIQRNDSSYFGLSLRMPTTSVMPSFSRDHGPN